MEWPQFATGISALVAAAAGVASLYVQLRDRGERLLVEEGSIRPGIDHYTSFYVVNLGKAEIRIRDYGFVLYSGKLHSIPATLEMAAPGDEIDAYCFKEDCLPPLAHAEAGMYVRGTVAGFYVCSTTRARPVVRFHRSVRFHTRLLLRVRLLRPEYT